MTLVRYTADGGHYRVGGVGFDPGDERDVDDGLAAYLADHEDFEVLEELGTEDDVDEKDDAEALEARCSRCGQSHDDGACWDLIEDGVCPWCDDYEGDGVPQHAGSAHPEEWAEYTED